MKKFLMILADLLWKLGEYFSRLGYNDDGREDDFLKGIMRLGRKRFY